MLAGWSATATWRTAFRGNGVQADGVEAVRQSDALTGAIERGIASFDVTTSLKAWQAGAANRGWLLTWRTSDGWGISSAEAQAAGERPRLVVTWKPASPSASIQRQSGGDAPAGSPAPHLAALAWATLATDAESPAGTTLSRRRPVS